MLLESLWMLCYMDAVGSVAFADCLLMTKRVDEVIEDVMKRSTNWLVSRADGSGLPRRQPVAAVLQ
jgi:hypothetical protein